MHYRLVLLALAAAVSAQSSSNLPSCATTCVTSELPSDCNGDPKCICSAPGFIDAISCCIFKACDTADQQAALDYAKGVCVPAGVTTLPTAATCASTGTAASATASSENSASGSATVTSALSSAVTSTAASGSSGSAESSAAATTGSSASGSSGSSTAASSSAAAATSNAANPLVAQGAGVVCAGLLGLAGML